MTFPKAFAKIFCLLLATKAIYSDFLDLPVEEESIQINGSALPVSTFTRNSSTQSPATFTISRASTQYCQVRLDFEWFDVGNTNTNGNCIGGLVITGESNSNNAPDSICGLNNGSHVYLNFDGNTTIALTINLDDTLGNTTNQWSIMATQIPCSDTTVSSDCLQYYPESSGTVKSFNFRNVVSIPSTLPTITYQISNLNYLVCIAPNTNSFSTITWTKGVETTNYYFVVNKGAAVVSSDTAGTIRDASFDYECLINTAASTSDYVEILNGTYDDTSASDPSPSDLYCGVGFPSTVTSTTTPFRLRIYTDSGEAIIGSTAASAEGSVGFSLSYLLN